jgi:hypothetical protein
VKDSTGRQAGVKDSTGRQAGERGSTDWRDRQHRKGNPARRQEIISWGYMRLSRGCAVR